MRQNKKWTTGRIHLYIWNDINRISYVNKVHLHMTTTHSFQVLVRQFGSPPPRGRNAALNTSQASPRKRERSKQLGFSYRKGEEGGNMGTWSRGCHIFYFQSYILPVGHEVCNSIDSKIVCSCAVTSLSRYKCTSGSVNGGWKVKVWKCFLCVLLTKTELSGGTGSWWAGGYVVRMQLGMINAIINKDEADRDLK